jgi:malate/lactate dehydrogenase
MVFGNHSLTQYPAINNIKIKGKQITDYTDLKWLQTHFIEKVQKRGG